MNFPTLKADILYKAIVNFYYFLYLCESFKTESACLALLVCYHINSRTFPWEEGNFMHSVHPFTHWCGLMDSDYTIVYSLYSKIFIVMLKLS